jgi:transcriptional regulator with XRE-family HTH domain
MPTLDLEEVCKMNDILKLVGAKIRDIRKEKGISQEALGEMASFHYSYIGGVERGERNISLKNLAKIADCLEVEIDVLLNYVRAFDYFTDKEVTLKEIVALLLFKDPKEVKMAQNILNEIFRTYEK